MKNKFPLVTVLISLVSNAIFSQSVTNHLAPSIKDSIVTDTIWGVTVKDEFRNIENLNEPIVREWFSKNDAHADKILSKIKNRDYLFNFMTDLNDRKSFSVRSINVMRDDSYYYLKKYPEDEYFKLYHRPDFSSQEKLIYDPKSFREKTGNPYTINYIKPSWDGNFVAIAMSYAGKEISQMVIYNMTTNKILPNVIDNSSPSGFGGVSWLSNNSGLIYLHFPEKDPNSPLFKKNTSAVLHKLKDNSGRLHILLNEEKNSKLFEKDKGYPLVEIPFQNSSYLLAFISGSSQFQSALFTEISELDNNSSINWKPLYDPEEKIAIGPILKGDTLIYKTAKNSPNYKIASTRLSNPNFQDPVLLVPELEDEVIEDFSVTSEALYFHTYKNGVEAKLYVKPHNGDIKQINTPIQAGYIKLDTKGVNSPDIWVSMDGWTDIYERYKYDLSTDTFKKQNILDPVNYPEFNDIAMEEIEVVSHDGIKVPLSIIHSKKITKNGGNPIFIESYGAYGSSINPIYSPQMLAWVAQGGIYAIAHVRGGGEKGENWRLGGFKTTKPNSWKDLIACTEFLIEEGYTKKGKITIYSNSAGGIVIGGAVNERPNLFGAVIGQVPLMNPLRNENGLGGGGTSFKEYGTVKDSVEAMSLKTMDPYLNLRPNTAYPATLLTTGMNETRVSPAFPGKYVAKLRQYNISNNPILLDVDFEGGHSSGDIEKQTALWADFYAFAFWQTGHPDYQPE